MTVELTAAEQTGIAQFERSMDKATLLQLETSLASLQPGGSAERMPGAPRREVLDEMQRLIRREIAERSL